MFKLIVGTIPAGPVGPVNPIGPLILTDVGAVAEVDLAHEI